MHRATSWAERIHINSYLAVLITCMAMLGTSASPAWGAISHDGSGMSISDDETNWSDLTSFPNLGDAFARLRPQAFRLMMDWSSSARPHHWTRAHNMINRARAMGASQIVVTFKPPNAYDVVNLTCWATCRARPDTRSR